MTTDWHGAPVTPLSGGYSGETFLIGSDPADQVVLRIYRRAPERAVVDAGLLRLLRGVLPVASVLEVRPASADLWALLELAGRVEPNPVCELATQLLQAQARSGDLHAWPWETPRVDPHQAKRVL